MTAPDTVSDNQIKHNRRILYLLFAIGFIPLLLATVMYYSDTMIPSGRTNKGTLILPPLQWSDWQITILQSGQQAQETGIDEDKWRLLIINEGDCGEACEQSLYLARQVNVALGRRADRLERYYLGTDSNSGLQAELSNNYPRMHQAHVDKKVLEQQLKPILDTRQALQESYILLADPLGNIMMYYTPEQSGNDILSDLKNLLKLSNIG